VLYGCVFVSLLGFMARHFLQTAKWNTRLALQLTSLHKFLGHTVIIVGTLANATGIYSFRKNIGYSFPLELFQVMLYFFMAALLETAFQTS
jgi:hypothetical protein